MKIPFKEEDYDRIMNKISTDYRAEPVGFYKKMDALYSNKPEPTGGVEVRLRTKGILPKSVMKDIILTDRTYPCVNPKTVFTTKLKSITDGGYESNIEHEVIVHSMEEMHICLQNMGYAAYFNKTKYAFGVLTVRDGRKYHIEIERVTSDISNKSVLYVEIECVQKVINPDDVAKIVKDEKSIFEEFGLNPKLADKRPWAEILE